MANRLILLLLSVECRKSLNVDEQINSTSDTAIANDAMISRYS